MKAARVFQNGASKAVRLPKEFRFASDEVFLKKMGDAVIIFPKRRDWQPFVNSLSKFSEDFMSQREQLPIQDREVVFE